MPKMPDFSAIETPAPQPSRAAGRADLTTGLEAAGAKMLETAGVQVASTARLATAVYAKEKQEIDTARAEDAFNTLRAKQIDLTYGDAGYTRLLGKDAVTQPFAQQYVRQLSDTSEQLFQGLGNDEQRQLFRRRADASVAELTRGALIHGLQQGQIYRKQVLDGVLSTETLAAAAAPPDELGFRGSVARMDAAISRYADETGAPPEEVQAMRAETLNKALVARFQSWMYADPIAAQTAFSIYADKFNPATRLEMERHIKATAQPIEAKSIVDRVMTQPVVDQVTQSVATGLNSSQIPPEVQLGREQDRLRILNDELASNPNDANLKASIANTEQTIGRLRTGASGPGGAPVVARDTRAMMGEWIANAEAMAEKTHPGDALFRDLVVSQVRTRVSTIVAAQEGVERQANSFLLTAAAGVGPDGRASAPVTDLSTLLSNPQARMAWNNLGADAQRGVVAYVEQNAMRAEGRPGQVNARLEQSLFSRMVLPANDPNAITRPEQLTPYVAQGLSVDGHTRLIAKMDQIQHAPEGAAFQRRVQQLQVNAGRLMRSGIQGQILAAAHPEQLEQAQQDFALALDAKIEEFRKAGKDPAALLTPGNPDYMGGFDRVSSYLPSARGAVSDAAARAKQRAFETKLTPTEEAQFQQWKAKYAPNDSGADYDFRGAFKAGLVPAANGHWPDTFKKPNHPTFSVESQYATGASKANAGTWAGQDKDVYVPAGAVFVSGDADFAKLKKGAKFVGPDGVPRTKP